MGVPGQPDWAAMAEANEREHRRKRRLRVTAGAVGVVTVAGLVAVALSFGGKKAPAAAVAAAHASPSAKASASRARISGLKLGAGAQAGPADGRTGPALTLPGNHEGYAEVTSDVVNTAASFTISAVVRNNAPAQPKAAVSQGGDGFFSLYLGREDSSGAARNRWVFKVQTAAETGKSIMALSTAPATPGRWTTLTGVYDAGAHTISLYVDGALAQTTPAPAILSTGGPLEIGRARYKSHWVDFWDGSVTDVQHWDQPLSAAEAAQLATAGSTDVPARTTWLHS